MSLTLKQILDAVQLESGMSTELAYATATDDGPLRLLYLANRSANDLSQYPWQALRKTYSFSLTADTSYDLPSDYRAFIEDTAFGDSRLWGIDFPTNQTEWNYLQASTGGTGIRVKARIIGDTIKIYQPNSGETISIEYLINTPIVATDSTRKQRFDADTDTWLLDDDLLIKDVIWRNKKLLGLPDWQVDFQDFKHYEMNLRGQEAGAQTIVPGDSDWSGEPYYDLYRPVPNA